MRFNVHEIPALQWFFSLPAFPAASDTKNENLEVRMDSHYPIFIASKGEADPLLKKQNVGHLLRLGVKPLIQSAYQTPSLSPAQHR
ncbi:hypothetical protein CORC01_12299 [Colletotrichum orchidophilum]|uniref:Uncharacterized protein n=1 Tax=Colletotrichum orchidophilum TaxID=1209926 RepID=A0A1G4ATJ4_9PEZI|nr:uncharacterized protein CORC01_12299 [Colletotrichum orchidophilum]OHE92372.1 hypothetical protein CORC01_12299 [Colletotrichum orchidophilum]